MSVKHWLCAIGALALFAGCPARALAATLFAGCLDEFWAGQPPVLAVEGNADALCSSHFASLYSEQTETPLYSAEHLTPDQIHAAIRLHRDGEFHEDQRLSPDVASTLED